MANPIPYNNLFDIDGLKAAIIDCETTSDEFSASVTEDFKRIDSSVKAATKSLQALNDSMGSRTIKLIDEASQQAIIAYAQEVVNLTKQIKDQQAAISAMTGVVNANKQAIADAKVQQAQYAAQLAQGKAQQQAINVQIANTTLQMKQLALANKQGAQAQNTATGSYKEAAQRLTALGNAIKNTAGGFTATTPALQAQIKQYNDLNDKLKTFDATMGNHQRNVGNYKSALGNLQGELTSYAANLFTLAAAMETVNKTFDTALDTDATRTSLGYILGNTELADEKLRALKATANRLGLEFVSTAKAYSLFTGAAKASNFSLEESDKIFNSVSRAVGILHLPADKAANAFYALQEMISKGTVQSKELQRQLGQAIPGAVNIMAEALGVSVSRLRDMEKSGELLTADVLPKFAAQLDKTFAPGVDKVDSLQASVNNLKNTFSEMVDEDTAIGQFFKNIITNVNNIASSIAKTVNSSSWQEFWLRFKPALGDQIGKNNNTADLLHNLQAGRDNSFNTSVASDPISTGVKQPIDQVTKRVNDLKIALDEARKTYMGYLSATEKGILSDKDQSSKGSDLTFKKLKQTYDTIKTLIDLYQTEYPAAFQTSQKANKELSDAQLTSIEEIRKRITELSKLPGSATKGSEINLRIDALKKRLHELQPSLKAAKDGFQILEDQIKKTMLALQDSIIKDYAQHQGKESENTKRLADAYENLNAKLVKLQQLRDAAILKSKQADQIKTFGSLYPTTGKADPSGIDLPNDNKAKTSNSLDRDQAGLDIESIDETLQKVVTKYAQANAKIVDQYKKRNITKLEYDQELLESEISQTDEEYYLAVARNTKELYLAKENYGENSKQYRQLLEQKAKLDQAYSEKQIADLQKQADIVHALYSEMFAPLQQNVQVLGSAVNPGASKLFGDVTNGVQKFGEAQKNGGSIPDADKIQLAASVAIDATKTYTDYVIQASQQRVAALERELNYELEGAGNNAQAKRAIEAEYTERIREEKVKQAKLNKAAAAVEILINTAVAVSKTIAETGFFGIPLAVIVGALGAAELALVLAQPIPQYEKGREGGKAEVAEVNEKGPELIGKGNKYRIANKGKRGLAMLRDGEKVLTADKTTEMMLNREIQYSGQSAETVGKSKAIYDMYVMNTSRSDIDYEQIKEGFKEAVADLPYNVANFDEKGVTKFVRTKNTKIMDVRNRNRFN